MLIRVELPITTKNVVNIDAVKLIKAHDYFLYNAQISKGHRPDFSEQYKICRSEILNRLKELEERKV